MSASRMQSVLRPDGPLTDATIRGLLAQLGIDAPQPIRKRRTPRTRPRHQIELPPCQEGFRGARPGPASTTGARATTSRRGHLR